jgi:hypothetical protein
MVTLTVSMVPQLAHMDGQKCPLSPNCGQASSLHIKIARSTVGEVQSTGRESIALSLDLQQAANTRPKWWPSNVGH